VKCTGCRNCVDSCPYGVIYFNEDLNLAQKCTGCAHLLDGKGGKEAPKIPRCVDACPTEAIRFGEESEFKNLVAKAEVMQPKLHAKPRVYYLSIPKKFVAGTVYDPVEEEVVVGAACTLTDSSEGTKFHAITDGFGDFWFENLGTGTYSLEIEAKGFPRKMITAINTKQDVNLGDIPIS
jgi:NAD-dependent dihydropyrimidine dehydrogenase PreA subunit